MEDLINGIAHYLVLDGALSTTHINSVFMQSVVVGDEMRQEQDFRDCSELCHRGAMSEFTSGILHLLF